MATTTISERELNDRFEALMKRGAFKPVTRFLNGPDAEDRLQDAVAQTWQAFRHYALDNGKLLSPGELVVMCGRRARDRSRHFVPRGKSHPNLDAMSEAAYRQGRTEVVHVDPFADDGNVAERGTSPESHLISAMDLRSWLAEHSGGDHALLSQRMAGATLGEIAGGACTTVSAAFRRLRWLGWSLAERAGVRICNRGNRQRPRSVTVPAWSMPATVAV